MLFLTETWLPTEDTVVTGELTPPGYTFIKVSRSASIDPGHHGGIVTVRTFKHRRHPQWYNEDISSARRERRRAERRWRKVKFPENFRSYHDAKDKVKKALLTAKSEYFKEKLSDCTPKSAFGIINSILNRKDTVLPAHDSPVDVSNQFASFFADKVRDISCDPKNSSPLLNVDFEGTDLGGFTQNRVDPYDWLWRKGRSRMHVNGPLVDHSTGTSTGHFMFVNTVNWRSGQSAEILSPELPSTTSPSCLQYHYYITGISPGSLTVRVKTGVGTESTSVDVGVQSGDKGSGWHRGLADIPAQANAFKVSFEATGDSVIGGEMAVDDVQLTESVCAKDVFDCSFESVDSELCGFVQDPTDNGNVVRMSGKTDSFYTGPSFDHTYGNSSGHYVYMEATPLGLNQKVRIISPTLRGVPSGRESHCLLFWYHMYGMAVDSLAVYIVNASRQMSSLDSMAPNWILRGNRGNRWRATEIPITARLDYKIVFVFSRGVRYDGDIAIDDVIVTNKACPGHHVYANVSSVSCDFEEADICHYTQDTTTDTEDWQWGNGATYIEFTGPSFDHTRGDELGFYIFFERSSNGGNDARIISPPIQPQRASSCVEFWYHMYGTDVNSLQVYISRMDGNHGDRPVLNITGNRGDQWHRAEVMAPASNHPLHLVFHAFGGAKFRDNIAVDDVRIYESAECPEVTPQDPTTPTIPPLVHSISCTFERGWCNFTQETDDVFDWRLGQGGDTNQNTPNMVDHTFFNSTGNYAFIKSSQRFLRTDDRARIRSPLLHPSAKPRCLTFFYFMASKYADFLNVYVVPYGQTRSFDPQLVIFGPQEPEWIKAYVPIEPSMATAISVVFEGVIGRVKTLGDIAIDDIMLEENECGIPDTSPTVYPATANCDFELDRGCDYVQLTDDEFDWVRHRGRTGSEGTGPEVDHTLGTSKGFYFYAEASQPQRPGDRAAFLTPLIAGNNQPMCLRFFYHMSGVDTGSLRVSLLLPGHHTGSSGLEILRLHGQTMSSWLPAHVDVIEIDGPLQLKFDAVIGDSFKSDIAIDDISFIRRPCDGLPSESLCDFSKGVHDCNYEESGGPSIYFQWSWYDSTTPAIVAKKNMLDSLSQSGIRDAFVFILVGDKPIPPGTTTNISSPFLSSVPTVGHCVEFNYILIGSSEITVNVIVEGNEGSSHFLQTLVASKKWKRTSISLLPSEQFNPFRINFMARMRKKTDNDIEAVAIDDISILEGVCASGNVSHLESPHNPTLVVGILLAVFIIVIVIVIVIFLYFRRRIRRPFQTVILQRRLSDEHPITMSLANDSTIEGANEVDEYRS
ncbi:MAM and LDL-receptor class A domain-containing protein 1-like [Diadema antillarum]|uniref:MAM and LDL-receptor class A domain-containing protein 1-like n=1 Tax=Diadema antillarum TaxID=105358 RepID=UPI003A848753